MSDMLLCSNCFSDHGLRLEAHRIGKIDPSICQSCKTDNGRKLNKELICWLAEVFFVRSSVHRTEYGASPTIAYNEYHYQKGDVKFPSWIQGDVKLIEDTIKMGFFHYGCRLWRIGEIEPLKALKNDQDRDKVIDKILKQYPAYTLNENEIIYRLRLNPEDPLNPNEFDSPPTNLNRKYGRLDSKILSIMYCSQDLEGCIHECRATVEDKLYVAILHPTSTLKLLDLTELINEENVTEFESLDIAIHMLFFAKEHSYEISQAIALAAKNANFDGIIYPSYFSQVRSGAMPYDSIYGISIRRIPQFKEATKSQIISNIALFGSPIRDKIISIKSINSVTLNMVNYDIRFGAIKQTHKKIYEKLLDKTSQKN